MLSVLIQKVLTIAHVARVSLEMVSLAKMSMSVWPATRARKTAIAATASAHIAALASSDSEKPPAENALM